MTIEEFLLPDLRTIRDDLSGMAETIDRADSTTRADGLWAEVLSLKGGVLAVLGPLDARIDWIDRKLRTPIDIARRVALEAPPRLLRRGRRFSVPPCSAPALVPAATAEGAGNPLFLSDVSAKRPLS